MRSLVTTVVGNVATDPTLIDETAGKEVLAFRIAIDCSYFDQATNKWQEKAPQFLTVYARRELAKNAASSFNKGERVIVSGKLSSSEWEDSEGNNRFTLAISADALGHELRWARTKYFKTAKNSNLAELEVQEYVSLKHALGDVNTAIENGLGIVPKGGAPTDLEVKDTDTVPF